MTTELLFRDDAYLRTAGARVLSASERGFTLDRTVFYPQGGGQAGDTGTARRAGGELIRIIDTRKGDSADEVLHLLAPGSPAPEPGDMVLFPSYLMHAVPPNKGGRRITLSFNALPTQLDSWGYVVRFG